MESASEQITKQDIASYVHERYKNVFSKELLERYTRDYIGFTSAKFIYNNKLSTFLCQNHKILDVGCGAGSLALYLHKKGYQAYGIEINEFEYKIAKQRFDQLYQYKKSIYTHGSALELPYPDDSFDVVTFFDVLEHIENYELALKEAKRILKANGKIFIIAPNYCAFRQEAHYHVPWIPFFPRKLAVTYLKFLGKDPWFYNECVFHLTNFKIIRILRKLDLTISSPLQEKIKENYQFNLKWFSNLLSFAKKFHLISLVNFVIKMILYNPFKKSLDLVAIKDRNG